MGPWNRYAFVHVSEVVPTVPVPRGTVAPLAAGEEAIDAEALFADAYADGIAIIRDGALIYERYSGEMHAGSLHLSQSVGKSVMGLTIAALGLDTSALVTDIVPEVRGSGYEGATLQHLLDMTAAIDFVEDYEAFIRYDAACGWHPPIPGSPGTMLEFLPTIGPASWAHGTRFHYATPNTDLLGFVAERVTGKPLAQVIAEQVWGPVGAEHDAELTVDPAGAGAIGGGFCATARDYARLGAYAAHVQPPLGLGDPVAFADATVPVSADGYGYQWWRRDGVLAARGIHGQLIATDGQTTVAVLSSWPEAVEPVLDAKQRAFVRRLLRRRYT